MEPQVFLDGRVTLYPGDCIDVLASLPENSVDSVVCDPPYHLTSIVKRFGPDAQSHLSVSETKDLTTINAPHYKRLSKGFMGKQWDGGDIAFQPSTWAAVLRVLKPGGYLLAFASTRGFGRMSVAIEDAGFITHPLIAWVFGSGFPKATRIKAEGYDGFRYGGQALKPAIEPIYMGQKPFEKGLSGTENILKWGTGALNVDGCRISTGDDLNGGAYAAVGGRGVSSSLHAGSGMNQPGKTTGKVYEQPAGRWPANLILSYPEDEYQLDPFATPEQRKEVWRWFYENA